MSLNLKFNETTTEKIKLKFWEIKRNSRPPKKEPEITKEPEPAQVDKSSVRKSILNMKADEAQKKREQNEVIFFI